MARTVDEIKKVITDKYIGYEAIKQAYELDESKTFEEQFSKASIESILFYCVAFCVWTLETLFDTHKNECQQLLDEKKPHRLKWYRDKALAFQYGRALVVDMDIYDNTGVADSQLAAEHVVKYAAALEKDGLLYIKVAGESNGVRDLLPIAQEAVLTDYFNEIKDAGVKFVIINRPADAFQCQIDIYYNPLVLDANGYRLDGTDNTPVQTAVNNYIENLPFNGEYSNVALVDVLQKIDGVVIPELKSSQYKYGAHAFAPIDAKVTPDSGYLRVYNPADLSVNFIAYQTTQ